MSKLDKDEVIAKFTEAYKAANGKAPQIEAKSGWFSVDGGKNIRLAQLNDLIADLSKSAPTKKAAPKKAEAKQSVTEKAEKSSAKAETKKLAANTEAKKPAAKVAKKVETLAPKVEKKVAKKTTIKTAKQSKAKGNEAFSVKAFWAEKLANEHPGSKLPR